MKAIVTICSKDKDTCEEPIPAKDRYLSTRITLVDSIARELHLPLYILSGKYGFIHADMPIAWYEHQLQESDIPELLPRVIQQIKEAQVTEIEFHGKEKEVDGWTHYHEILEQACAALKIPFTTETLQPY